MERDIAPFTDKEHDRWWRVVDYLRDEQPPTDQKGVRIPVKVWRVPYRRDYGSCVLLPDQRFLIRIAKRLAYSDAVYALAEEWAHAGVWFDQDNLKHGDAWGLAYAQVLAATQEA